jgi:hypothetical protein
VDHQVRGELPEVLGRPVVAAGFQQQDLEAPPSDSRAASTQPAEPAPTMT